MADKVRTKDATVGKANAKAVNRSASDVRKGYSVKKGHAKGGMLEAATVAHEQNIQESLGSSLRPTANLYAPNAAESGLTQRSTRILAPAIDRSGAGFQDARRAAAV